MKAGKTVGIAQMALCRAPEQLSCLGLGSCVAIILYDPTLKLGGIVHVLLPHAPNPCERLEKYADTGTRKLFLEMISKGARKERIVAKLVGGAQMFPDMNLYVTDIGKQNSIEARRALRELGIRVVAEDLEGNRGRSAYFDPETGAVTVETAFSPTKII
ncbi:MAG: chemotaxis protein CheD [Thermoplasmata archaeon]